MKKYELVFHVTIEAESREAAEDAADYLRECLYSELDAVKNVTDPRVDAA